MKKEFKFLKVFKRVHAHVVLLLFVARSACIGSVAMQRTEEAKRPVCFLLWEAEQIQAMVESSCKSEESCE